ncbi:MAG: hypothetical protein ACRC4N_09925, partial [Gammaproteobacteria bacterium]
TPLNHRGITSLFFSLSFSQSPLGGPTLPIMSEERKQASKQKKKNVKRIHTGRSTRELNSIKEKIKSEREREKK